MEYKEDSNGGREDILGDHTGLCKFINGVC